MATMTKPEKAKYNKAKTVKDLIAQISLLSLPADRVTATPGLGPEGNIGKPIRGYFDMAIQASSLLAKEVKKFDENGAIVIVPSIMDTALVLQNGVHFPFNPHYSRILEALEKASRKGKPKNYEELVGNLSTGTYVFNTTWTTGTIVTGNT